MSCLLRVRRVSVWLVFVLSPALRLLLRSDTTVHCLSWRSVFRPLGPTGILFAVCVIACVVGSVVSNNAAALLLYPIVVDLSNEVAELDRRQAVLVLMVASSASFLTPVRMHQAALMST